jgi:hypothetical protein
MHVVVSFRPLASNNAYRSGKCVSGASGARLTTQVITWVKTETAKRYATPLQGYIGCFIMNYQGPEVTNRIFHSFLKTGLVGVEAKARIAVFCSRLIALNSMPTPIEVILETTE